MENETVLVIPSARVPNELRDGYKQGYGILPVIENHGTWRLRADVEENPNYKQIIPYTVVFHGEETDEQVLGYTRLKGGGEARLHNLYSLGFGGHMNDTDGSRMDRLMHTLWAAALRELQEEVYLPGLTELKMVGTVNDNEAGPVEAVHLGVVFSARVRDPRFRVLESDKIAADWQTMDDIFGLELADKFETWASHVACSFFKNQLP